MALESLRGTGVPETFTEEQAAEAMAWHRKSVERKVGIIDDSNYQHRIVTHIGFFKAMKDPSHVYEATLKLDERASPDSHRTTAAIMPDDEYRKMELSVERIFPNWDIIRIIDTNVMYVSTGRMKNYITYHTPTIVSALERIDDILTKTIKHPFPTHKEFHYCDCEKSNDRALETLQNVEKELNKGRRRKV